MQSGSRDSLRAALRDGVISREQYDALIARMQTDHAEGVSADVRRRLVAAGLLLLGILAVFLAVAYLTMGQRLALVSIGLGASAALAAYVWRDPSKVDLSRGLLGLAVFEAMLVLLLARWERHIDLEAHVAMLVAVAGFGAGFGIQQNSTWLATPSFVALYVGLVTAGLPVGSDFSIAVLAFSAAFALGVVGLVWAWGRGAMLRAREGYVRRKRVLASLARGHLVLFDIYLFYGLVILLYRLRLATTESLAMAGFPPFLVALVAILYARKTRDPKLLTVGAILLAVVAWIFVPISGTFFVAPVAVLVTAAALIYLGIRRRAGTAEPGPA